MSQAIHLCEDSDDNGEWPNTNAASAPPLVISRKRPRGKEESSNNEAYSRYENSPGNKNATGSAEFVVDLELADEVEVSVSTNQRKRRAKNDVAVENTERDVGSEDAQVTDHRESHQSIKPAAAALHPMNSVSEQTSRDDGSTNKHSQKASTSKPPSNELGRQLKGSPWEVRLSDLADYRKIHGHCNVPRSYSENTKLANWVVNQRCQYNLHAEGKTSSMTVFRIQELESLGFEWKASRVNCWVNVTAWEDCLSELADYRKIHGHCNVPKRYSENTKLTRWVGTQRTQYRLHLEGKTSSMTNFRIQALKDIGFEWGRYRAVWEDRWGELAEYRKIQGHCNVPQKCSENAKLGTWVANQSTSYKLHLEGKKSHMTTSRIQKFESLGFEWKPSFSRRKGIPKVGVTAWEDRWGELAEYRKIQGHCNVPTNYSENAKLATWVVNQRSHYRLHVEGKKSLMTLPRIQELERLGFKWSVRVNAWEDCMSELAEYRKMHGHCNVPTSYSENTKLAKCVAYQRSQYKLQQEGKKS
jgi:hypothetical protein